MADDNTMTDKKISPYHRWVKERLETDPEYKVKYVKRIMECNKKRYNNDPDFKAKKDEQTRTRNKQRYEEDQEYREKKIEQMRIYREKKKALKLQQSD